MFIAKHKGQSIVEYVVLIAVIVAAVLVMQVLVKRGYQGRLKSSADEMGEQFSASDTTIRRSSVLQGNQTVTSEVATGAEMQGFQSGARDIVDLGAYSATERTGGNTTLTTDTRTGAITRDDTRWKDLPDYDAPDYDFPDDGGP